MSLENQYENSENPAQYASFFCTSEDVFSNDNSTTLKLLDMPLLNDLSTETFASTSLVCDDSNNNNPYMSLHYNNKSLAEKFNGTNGEHHIETDLLVNRFDFERQNLHDLDQLNRFDNCTAYHSDESVNPDNHVAVSDDDISEFLVFHKKSKLINDQQIQLLHDDQQLKNGCFVKLTKCEIPKTDIQVKVDVKRRSTRNKQKLSEFPKTKVNLGVKTVATNKRRLSEFPKTEKKATLERVVARSKRRLSELPETETQFTFTDNTVARIEEKLSEIPKTEPEALEDKRVTRSSKRKLTISANAPVPKKFKKQSTSPHILEHSATACSFSRKIALKSSGKTLKPSRPTDDVKSQTLCKSSSSSVHDHPAIILRFVRVKEMMDFYRCYYLGRLTNDLDLNDFGLKECSVAVERLLPERLDDYPLDLTLRKNKNVSSDDDSCNDSLVLPMANKNHIQTTPIEDSDSKSSDFDTIRVDALPPISSSKKSDQLQITADEDEMSLDLRSALAASNEIAGPTSESALADDMDDSSSTTSELSLYAPSLSDLLNSPNRGDDWNDGSWTVNKQNNEVDKKFRIPKLKKTIVTTLDNQVEEIFSKTIRDSPKMISPVKDLDLSLIKPASRTNGKGQKKEIQVGRILRSKDKNKHVEPSEMRNKGKSKDKLIQRSQMMMIATEPSNTGETSNSAKRPKSEKYFAPVKSPKSDERSKSKKSSKQDEASTPEGPTLNRSPKSDERSKSKKSSKSDEAATPNGTLNGCAKLDDPSKSNNPSKSDEPFTSKKLLTPVSEVTPITNMTQPIITNKKFEKMIIKVMGQDKGRVTILSPAVPTSMETHSQSTPTPTRPAAAEPAPSFHQEPEISRSQPPFSLPYQPALLFPDPPMQLPQPIRPDYVISPDRKRRYGDATMSLFEQPCFNFLSEKQCPTGCKYYHKVPNAIVVFTKMQTYPDDKIQFMYETFIVKYRVTFCEYFPLICQLYGMRRMRTKFAALVRDCEKYERFDFFNVIFNGLLLSGMNNRDALNIIVDCCQACRASDEAILKIIERDLQSFIDILSRYLAKLTPEIIGNLLDQVSKNYNVHKLTACVDLLERINQANVDFIANINDEVMRTFTTVILKTNPILSQRIFNIMWVSKNSL